MLSSAVHFQIRRIAVSKVNGDFQRLSGILYAAGSKLGGFCLKPFAKGDAVYLLNESCDMLTIA
jgi:hypothetical protein